MRRWLAAAAALATFVVAASVATPGSASTASEHRALVIVDTGSTVIRRTITFTEDAITGIAALQRAGANPVVWSYSGQGGAVCKLFGVGRDAGPGCLGGSDGDNRYWAYYRAPRGATGFSYSQVGAGSTAVRDGDVEGWRFGTGAPPPFTPLVTSPPATAAPPTTVAPPVTGSATGGGTGAAVTSDAPSSSRATASTPAPGGTLPATGGSSSTTGSSPRDGRGSRTARTQAAASRRGAEPVRPGSSSGFDPSLLVFAGLVALLAAGIVVARRARRRPLP